jgi:hypothetical protein
MGAFPAGMSEPSILRGRILGQNMKTECREVTKVLSNDGNGDRQLQSLILMHSNITNTDHILHAGQKRTTNPTALSQQLKQIACALGSTGAASQARIAFKTAAS